MHPLLLVAIGGAFGSLSRYLMSGWISAQVQNSPAGVFPWGTFGVNLLGCAVGGLVAAWAQHTDWLTPQWRLFLFTGILGGFTTFSAFGLETLNLLRSGQSFMALTYAASSVLLGVAAMGLTFTMASR